jgi:hypothetical protein
MVICDSCGREVGRYDDAPLGDPVAGRNEELIGRSIGELNVCSECYHRVRLCLVARSPSSRGARATTTGLAVGSRCTLPASLTNRGAPTES